jgi:uncharacterized protein involved in exopolysaccharide biosynthesis
MENKGLLEKESLDVNILGYLLQLKRHWGLVFGVFCATVISGLIAALLVKPTYQAEGKLRFTVNRDTFLSEIDKNTGELKPLVSNQNPLSTEIEVISSRPLLEKTIHHLNLQDSQGRPVDPEILEKKLDVSIVGGTDIVEIDYNSNSAKQSAAVVNTLMNLYIQNDIQTLRSQAIESISFLQQQIPQTEAAVRKAEEALRGFKELHNIVDLPEESKSVVTTISDLERNITTAKSEFDEATGRVNELKDQIGISNAKAIQASQLSQSSEIKDILQDLKAVERQLAAEKEMYEDSHPSIVSLREKRNGLVTLLQSGTQEVLKGNRQIPSTVRVELGNPQQSPIRDFLTAVAQQKATQNRLSSLMESRLSHSRRSKILPQLMQQQRELERRLQAAQSTYETLLKKSQELQVARNTKSSNARIIETAKIPVKDASIRYKLIVAASGIVFGGFLATAIIPLLSLNRRFKESNMERQDLPLFAKIVTDTSNNYFFDFLDNNSSLENGMDSLIAAYPKIKCLKNIMITGNQVSEAQSIFVANLAIDLASLDKKVLLIDLNFQHPKQHQLFDISNTVGMADVLRDTLIRYDEFRMISHQVRTNLEVLTSGTHENESIDILNSGRIEVLLRYLNWYYDAVIIDAPPMSELPFFNVAIDHQVIDGIIFVSHPDLNQNIKNNDLNLLRQGKIPILGLVENSTDVLANKNHHLLMDRLQV